MFSKEDTASVSGKSLDSSVGIETGYRLERAGRNSSPGGGKNFYFFISSKAALGPIQPPTQWVQGALSQGVKRPRREADRSPPTTAEVKKTWVYASTPSYVFMT
jgi:hypothetical protein